MVIFMNTPTSQINALASINSSSKQPMEECSPHKQGLGTENVACNEVGSRDQYGAHTAVLAACTIHQRACKESPEVSQLTGQADATNLLTAVCLEQRQPMTVPDEVGSPLLTLQRLLLLAAQCSGYCRNARHTADNTIHTDAKQ